MLLSREHLSLSSLDLASPLGEFPAGPGRFFESHIRILELEGRLRQTPSVLVARSDVTGYVYVVEREQAGRHVVCKLGNWVQVEKLGQLAEACYEPRCSLSCAVGAVESEAPVTTPQLHKQHKKKREAIEQLRSLVSKRPRTASIASPGIQTPQSQQFVSISTTTHQVPGGPEISSVEQIDDSRPQPGLLDSTLDAQASLADILQTVRAQYSQALYHSKGSLAYFAKGPLSRARSAFQFDCDSNLDMGDLIDFLKSLVVGIPQIDKKYKETLPKLVEDMKVFVDSDNEPGSKPKRRKAKKMKLGKDGLWTNEVDHVKKWWRSSKPEVREDAASANPQAVQYHIALLRSRETQLQMILLLEIMALEAIRPAHDIPDDVLPGLPAEVSTSEKKTSEFTTKKKDKHDHSLLVNLHADRMSIWQSTTMDEMRMIAAETQAKDDQDSQSNTAADSDPLKDFCVDIIVPFFAGRLPELCADLNKKLGGPVAAPPPRTKKSATSSTALPTATALAKPGTAAKRPAAMPSRTSLDKIFENDQQKRRASRRPVDVLARMRSATPAMIPGLKREGSEPLSLDRIPSLNEKPRNMLGRSVSSAGVEELKNKKKLKVEAELREAISALKKPNRQLVGKSIADELEQRAAATSSSHPRKQKKPIRNAATTINRVQVKATPANNRFRDAVAEESRTFGSTNSPPLSKIIAQSSPSVMIPGTALRPGNVRDRLTVGTPDKVPATPLGPRTSKSHPQILAEASSARKNDLILPSSPIMSRKKASISWDVDVFHAIPEDNEQEVHEERLITSTSTASPRVFVTTPRPKSRAISRPVFEDSATDENIVASPAPAPRLGTTQCDLLFETPPRRKVSATSAISAAKAVETVDISPATKTKHNSPVLIQATAAPSLYDQMGWNNDYEGLF
ncbi:DNA replication regulator SLD3-domain-containing protein [Coniella lustricola]|uniref:DNA replication regulator SLD3-domain-containing protein n=1 Tax=Coniella lustricola TaxID=2025994 RepID=A0A2T3AIV2_9PEZI|nr:DNA replication regulator SLD3-domain-containing protein [Coniella lustricola]